MSEKDGFEPADLPEDEEEKKEQSEKSASAAVFSDISRKNNLNMDSTQFIAYSLAKLVVAISDAKNYDELKAATAGQSGIARDFVASIDSLSAPPTP